MALFVVTLIANDGPTDHLVINTPSIEEAIKYSQQRTEYDGAEVIAFTPEWLEEHYSGIAMLNTF